MSFDFFHSFVEQHAYAPINVKPARGGGGGRQGMGWGFDCLCWPWSRAFDQSCSPGGGDV